MSGFGNNRGAGRARGGAVRGFSRGGRGAEGRGGGRGGGSSDTQRFNYPDGLIPPPDPKVMKAEGEIAKSTGRRNDPHGSLDLSQLSLDERLPRRPGFGTIGKPVTLWANYFQVGPSGDTQLYRYSVDIVPEVAGKKRKRLIQMLLSDSPLAAMGGQIVSDYKATLFSMQALDSSDLEFAFLYRSEGEDEAGPRPTEYRFRIQSTGQFMVSDLIDYLASTNVSASFAAKNDIVQALNILFGFHPKSAASTTSVGANRHYPLLGASAQSWDLGAGLRAWRGYFTSVRTATARILLNVQVKHIAMYDNVQLDRLMDTYLRANSHNLYKLDKFLRKLRVEPTHLPTRTNKAGVRIVRAKTISGLATNSDGQGLQHPPRISSFGADSKGVQFWLEAGAVGVPNPSTPKGTGGKASGKKGTKGKAPAAGPSDVGKYITIFDYFTTRYGKSPQANVPVVNVGNKQNPSYLPAEICLVCPGQPASSQLNPQQTQQMIRFAVRKPYENANSIARDGCSALGLIPLNSTLDEFNMTISPKMITVPGRMLAGPTVKYRQRRGEKESSVQTRFGSWNMENIMFTTSSSLSSWTTLLVLLPNQREPDLNSTLRNFHQALNDNGVNASAPIPGPKVTVTDQNYDSPIGDMIRRISTNPSRPKLILVILPKSDTGLYNRIKYYGDVVYGIHTICVIGEKFTKMRPSREDRNSMVNDLQYFANVALKFNLKLGGMNQSLDPAKLGVISQGKTMVVGIDVTHPSPGSSPNAPSVAGMVASVDKRLGQWPAALRIQEPRKEMVTNVGDMLRSRLDLWKAKNKNALPDNIIVYRDGVSEGQYDRVLEEELPLLRKACSETYPAPDTKKGQPKISIIIVGKRHHTRFYPTSTDRDTIDERSSNPKNGTIVDRGVTEARNWDFYLQAHTAIQGTARPAHYFVILDEIFAPAGKPKPPFLNAADVLEDLTHNMCYMFGRATKAVSICPPAYYADLVCERARCYLSSMFDGSTPSGTPAPSVSGGGGGNDDALGMAKIHDNMKDTMFYI